MKIKKLIIFFSLQVKKIDLPYDKTKEQRRAFCFVEFKEEDAVKKITEQSVHKIKDQEVRFYGFHQLLAPEGSLDHHLSVR